MARIQFCRAMHPKYGDEVRCSRQRYHGTSHLAVRGTTYHMYSGDRFAQYTLEDMVPRRHCKHCGVQIFKPLGDFTTEYQNLFTCPFCQPFMVNDQEARLKLWNLLESVV